jgi:hypothetical protein
MKLPRWAPYLLLGPITGPLARRLFDALEARQPVLAAVYGLGVLLVMVTLPMALIELLVWLR